MAARWKFAFNLVLVRLVIAHEERLKDCVDELLESGNLVREILLCLLIGNDREVDLIRL